MDLVGDLVPPRTPAAAPRRLRGDAAPPERLRPHRRARDDRRPRAVRPHRRARGARRPDAALRRPAAPGAGRRPTRRSSAQLALRDRGGRRWRAGAAKFFIDGVIDSGTAWLFEPGPSGEGTQPYWPEPDRYAEVVARFARAGFQCATHAIGDRAVAAALDAYRAAGRHGSAPHRIEHLETLRDAELARLARRGRRRLDAAAARRGPGRARPVQLARPPAARAGRGRLPLGRHPARGRDPRARLATGPWSAPTRASGLAWARLRRAPGHPERTPFLPGQALTRRGRRSPATPPRPRASSARSTSTAGSRPGCAPTSPASGADPVDCPADDLPDVPTLLTVVDGEIVFRPE